MAWKRSLIAGSLCLPFLAGACSTPAKASVTEVPAVSVGEAATAQPARLKLLVCCDSISAGARAESTQGFVDPLWSTLVDAGFEVVVVNVSLYGSRCDQWADWIGEALGRHRPDVLLLNCGTNDYVRSGSVPASFKEDYAQIIAAASFFDVKVITSLVQVSDRRNPGVPAFLPDSEVKVNAAIRELTQPLYELGVVGRVDFSIIRTDRINTPDGIHPSPIGHQLYAKTWYIEGRRPGMVVKLSPIDWF